MDIPAPLKHPLRTLHQLTYLSWEEDLPFHRRTSIVIGFMLWLTACIALPAFAIEYQISPLPERAWDITNSGQPVTTFPSVGAPGSVEITDINDSGDVVGYSFVDSLPYVVGLVKRSGQSLTTIAISDNDPETDTHVWISGINGLGEAVGTYCFWSLY
jgi:hypothetical protein